MTANNIEFDKYSAKKLTQLTFIDVFIRTIPKRRLLNRFQQNNESKVIIDGVSGTILPGQFVALLGASGKNSIDIINLFRGRKNNSSELSFGEVIWEKH